VGMELAFLCPPNLIGRLLRDSDGVEDLYSLLVRCEITSEHYVYKLDLASACWIEF